MVASSPLKSTPPPLIPWQQTLLNGLAVLVIVLMLAIAAQVLCSLLDINPLAAFAAPIPLFGNAITLNSLLDFQWHLLAIIALLPAALVWWRDQHVRVDFLYQGFSVRAKALVELGGHLLLTGPFLALGLPAAWSFMASAYRSGQGSRNDGLNDLFLIKAIVPFGFALLGLVLIIDIGRQLRRLRRGA